MAQPFARATFPLTGTDTGSLHRFRLRHAEFEHEHAVLTISTSAQIYPDMLTGNPVIVEWGTPDGAEVFTGYVVMANPTSMPTPTAPGALPAGMSVEVHALGTSFPMRQARQQVFTSLSADEIAANIVSDYQLDIYAENHPRVWSTYAQAGISDWSLLAQLAHDVGYTLYTRNAQVRFHSRLLEVYRQADSALLYDFAAAGNNDLVPNSRQVLSFSPTIGDVMGVDGTTRARRVIGDVDRRTKAQVSVQDVKGPPRALGPLGLDPIFTEYVVGRGVDSLADGSQWLYDIGEDSRWYITANAVVQGDTRLAPAHPVYFRNLPADFSGYWFVRSVNHDLQLGPGGSIGVHGTSYRATLELGRDGFGENVSAPSSLPQRVATDLQDFGVPREISVVSQLTAQGYWRASNLTKSSA